MVITLEQAKKLEIDTIIYHISNKNADGTRQRWKVNGKVKLWGRNPNRIRVPIKHGLYSYDYLTEDNLDMFKLDGDKMIVETLEDYRERTKQVKL